MPVPVKSRLRTSSLSPKIGGETAARVPELVFLGKAGDAFALISVFDLPPAAHGTRQGGRKGLKALSCVQVALHVPVNHKFELSQAC